MVLSFEDGQRKAKRLFARDLFIQPLRNKQAVSQPTQRFRPQCFDRGGPPDDSKIQAAIHQPVEHILTSLNFEFLRTGRPELADLGGFAEHYSFTDAAGSLIKLRLFAEQMVKAVFVHHRLQLHYEDNLNDLLNDPTFKTMVPAVVQDKLHRLRIKGNKAAHGTLPGIRTAEVIDYIKEAHSLGSWYAIAIEGRGRDTLPGWMNFTPESVGSAPTLQKLNKAAQQKLTEQEALMTKLLEDVETARASAESAEKTPAETQVILAAAQQAASALDFSEAETRSKLIDDQLLTAGWKVGVHGQSTDEVGQEAPVLHQPTAAQNKCLCAQHGAKGAEVEQVT